MTTTTNAATMLDSLREVTDNATVGRVFGSPVHHDGVLVLPVAKVSSGGGSGTGPASDGPENGGASVARTRMSNPARSRRSRNDSTRPRDSSSMSNSSAPTAATPRIASALRAGWRIRVSQESVSIGGSTTA